MIRYFDYGRYHGKGVVGSTRLRVKQLERHWPELKPYKYGENPEVMVWQKIYIQEDWRFMEHFKGIQILDICDPDWLEGQNVKQTIDLMDGVTCPTQAIAEFLRQLTDKPIKVIPDRHELSSIPEVKTHKGTLSKAVWFGYSQNAELLKEAIPTLEKMNVSLTVISNDNPYVDRWGSDDFKYEYKKFDEETIAQELQNYDVCVLPQGNRPQDRFKSNNKTTLAWLAGVPVVKDGDELRAMKLAIARNEEAYIMHGAARLLYDVKLSVKDMKAFIDQLTRQRGKNVT